MICLEFCQLKKNRHIYECKEFDKLEYSKKINVNAKIIVYFWSKSCPACHAKMPHFQKLRDEYSSKGLEVVSVHRPMGEFDLDKDGKVRRHAKGQFG